jgi:GDSL-like Lipase/Acylhydrolase family
MRSVRRERILRGVLLLGSTLLALVLAEIVLRVANLVPQTDQSNARRVYDRSNPDYYKLKPNLKAIPFAGILLSSNEYGFRDRKMSLARREGVYRIAVMGDSWGFGWGVEYDETIVRRLEKRLRERYPGRNIELLNFSIPGHNMNDHYYMLKNEVLRFQPDRVLLLLHLNDIEQTPAAGQEEAGAHSEEPAWRRASRFVEEFEITQLLLARLLQPLAIRLGLPNRGFVDHFLWEYSPQGPYLANYEERLDGFLALARKAHLEVSVFLLPLPLARSRPYQLQPVDDVVEKIFAARGVAVTELLDSYSQHAKDELVIHVNDHHPNPFASKLLAEEIAQKFTLEAPPPGWGRSVAP